MALDLAVLRSLLPPVLPPGLDKLARDYLARHDGGDETDFLAWLHEGGHIDAGTLRDALAGLSVSFTQAGLANTPRAKVRTLGLLGKGAMGEVHIARDEGLHRNVAVKRLGARIANEPALVKRFLLEARITAQLDHPGIVPVYALDNDADGTPTYAMKLVRGRTLKSWLEDTRTLVEEGRPLEGEHKLAARLELFLQMCDPVAYAHARGVLHRDLKPENVMVGPYGEVFVMDWGLARLIGSGEEPLGDLGLGDKVERTEFGLVVGTPAYMSPEQAQGQNDKMDARSDLYSLGIILFELTTLRKARVAKGSARMIEVAARGRLEPIVPLDGRERIPRELQAVIRRATALRPDDRYPSVEVLASEVRRVLRGEAVRALPDKPMQRLGRWVARHRDTSAAIGLSLVLLLVLGGGGLTASGLAALEVTRQTAAEREAKLGEAVGRVSDQARRLDLTFRRVEGLVNGIGAAASRVLAQEPGTRRVWMPADFATPGAGPSDLAPSALYGGPISLDAADVAIADGVSPRAVDRRIRQLVSLQPDFLRALLLSAGEDKLALAPAARRALVADEGTPVVWAYAAVEEGVIAALPGTGVYPERYDPRTRPWYAHARTSPVPHWGAVYADESGMGLLLDCGMALQDDAGVLLGVAAVDLTVGWVVDHLLDPEGLMGEAFLVDSNGSVVVRGGMKEKARHARDYEPTPLPWPQPVEAVRGGQPRGWVETPSGEVLLWTRLEAVPWTYVVALAPGAL